MCQVAIDGGVHAIDTGAEKGHRPAAGIERAAVSLGVDALCHAADDHEALRREMAGEITRIAGAALRRVATSDDGERRQLQEAGIAIDVKKQRRTGNLTEHGRVVVIAPGKQLMTLLREPGKRIVDSLFVGRTNGCAFFLAQSGFAQAGERLADDRVRIAEQVKQREQFADSHMCVGQD